MNVAKKGRVALGRGLSALISTPPVSIKSGAAVAVSEISSSDIGTGTTTTKTELQNGLRLIDRNHIIPNPAQPRKVFEEQDLNE